MRAPLYFRVVRRLRRWRRRLVAFATGVPPTGQAELGDLRRTAPLCDSFGFSRGTPVDRVYIDAFLARHAADIRGRVLEVQNAAYATRFGAGRVERADVVDYRHSGWVTGDESAVVGYGGVVIR